MNVIAMQIVRKTVIEINKILGAANIYNGLRFQRENRDKGSVGVRSSYLRAVGLTAEQGVTGGLSPFSSEEEEQFRRLAASPDIYERIAMSIAPSVFGVQDMKKAIACLLFGGMIFGPTLFHAKCTL